MKMKLPKALLCAVLASSMAYAGGTYRPNTIIKVEDGSIKAQAYIVDADSTALDALTKSQCGTNDVPEAWVKDGQGVLNIDTSTTTTVDGEEVVVPSATPTKVYNTIMVREGTVNISNTSIQNYNGLSNGVSNLVVGGKNAVLNLDNAHYEQRIEFASNYGSSVNIGSGDGSGTVNLTNRSTLHSDHCIFIGRVNTTYKGMAAYVQPSYAGTTGDTLYTYVENPPTSVVNISGASKMSTGTQIYLDNVTVNIGGPGSEMLAAERAINEPNTYFYGSYMGSVTGAQATVNVTEGGAFTMMRDFYTGTAADATSTVNVSGNGSTMTVHGDTYLGLGTYNYSTKAYESNSSTTSVKVSDNATLKLGDSDFVIGYLAQSSVEIGKTAKIEEIGSDKNANIYIDELGSLTNSGTIEAEIGVEGGIFTMTDDAVAAGLTATAGTINLSGDVTFTGEVRLGGLSLLTDDETTPALTINITQGTTLIFENQVALSNAVINVLLSDNEVSEGETLFTIASVDGKALDALNQAAVTFEHGGIDVTETVKAANANVGLNASYVTNTTIPEPTTATLSLLALMGLAARRRRK